MKKILIASLLFFFLSTSQAQAVSVSWDLTGSILQPIRNAWSAQIKGAYFTATSTASTSTFPFLNSTRFRLLGRFFDVTNSAGNRGNVLLSSGTSTRWVATSTLGLAGGGGGSGTVNSGTTGQVPRYDSVGTTVNPTSTVFIANNGRVGIGSTTPRAKFSIKDTAGVATRAVFSVASSSDYDLFTILGNRQININNARAIISDPSNFNWFFGDCGTLTATGQFNSCLGRNALNALAGGASNMAIGLGALGSNTSGNTNVAIGVNSIASNVSGSNNVAIGDSAGLGVSSNSYSQNTFLGARSGRLVSTGINNTFVGYESASTTSSGGNNISIGARTKLPSLTASNQLNIGNIIYGTSIDGSGSVLSTGNLGIGTTTPGDKLVLQVGNNAGFSVLSSNSAFIEYGKIGADQFRMQNDFTNVGLFEILYNNGAGGNPGTSAFTIAGTGSGLAGNIGIGTTSPAKKLSVAGSFRITGAIFDTVNSAGTFGDTLRSTETGTRWSSRKNYVEYFEDFVNETVTTGAGDYTETISGTGAICTNTTINTANRPGLSRCTTGTTATGRADISTGFISLALGQGTTTVEQNIRITTLASSIERYQVIFGLHDTATAANQVDGAYLLYDLFASSTGAAASANWQCVTVSNSVRTFTTSATAVTAGTDVEYDVVVNPAGTSVKFYVGGTNICTHTTNIPTGIARVLGSGFFALKASGLTARTFDLDYIWTNIAFTTSR